MAVLKSTKTCNLLYPTPQIKKGGGLRGLLCAKGMYCKQYQHRKRIGWRKGAPVKHAQASVEGKYWLAPETEDVNAMSLDEWDSDPPNGRGTSLQNRESL